LASPFGPRFNAGMPELTRKRVNDRPVTWHVHYAGVRVGMIVERSGAPPSSDQWQWCCGLTGAFRPSVSYLNFAILSCILELFVNCP